MVSFVLLVWLRTEALYEYGKLFGFKKLFKIKEYSDFLEGPEKLGLGLETISTPSLGYLDYLKVEHDNFFVRLITCPICLGTWLNLLICLILKDFSFFFVKLWVSFILYFTSVVLMKKSN
ncbi:hypothetical protein CL634_00165 [bacterium]|nr:hypothetical protein [bacterium]